MSSDEELDKNDKPLADEYKVSTWGKKVDGISIIDGYKFRGRQQFRRAREGLEKLLVKGYKGEVNGLKFEVLDARNKGIEIELDVQVSKNTKKGVDSRGVAVLKLYGPNKRKENSVLVTKNKESDIKFVMIISEKIVEPLLKSILAVDEKLPENKITNALYCEICEKAFNTMKGLKGHNTKIHKEGNNVENQDMDTEILWKEDDETDEESTEEFSEEIKEEKKYSSTCKECNLYMEAQKKYILIQKIKKHACRESKFKNKRFCTDCEYKANSEMLLKRHRRDKHEKMTDSTSPPPKKAKIQKAFKEEEKMEIDGDKNEDIEEREIEVVETEAHIRSKLMDEKILSKAKELNEKEEAYENKRRVLELEKKREEEERLQNIKQSNKKRKQDAKNVKKKLRKQNSHKITSKINIDNIPNLKPVPLNCSHLVNKGDKVYTVPGNGACGSNAMAAHLFQDELFGPKLKRKMNQFFAKHWERKYKNKTQCSIGSPFVRNVGGGGKISFTDPNKLIEYLQNSEEADYMWTDSEDLVVVADMYQVNIKVITTKGEEDTNPTINWILPDDTLKEFAELKNVELVDIVLLHENDVHFNLIVSEKSELATLGSLSFRSNIGPFMEVNEVKSGAKKELETGNDMLNSKENQNLKKELKRLKESYTKLEHAYLECEIQLKNKTEESEKLKIEIIDLKQLQGMKQTQISFQCPYCNDSFSNKNECDKHIKMNHGVGQDKNCSDSDLGLTSTDDVRTHMKQKQAVDQEYNCTQCCYQATSNEELTKHFKTAHTFDKDLFCDECKFQAKTYPELRAHKKDKHPSEGNIRCRVCGETFGTKPNLMEHRKNKHIETVAICKNKIIEKCPFSSKKCWWKHEDETEHKKLEIDFKCFNCSETFKKKSEMMVHKKQMHKSTVQNCNLFIGDRCPFNDKSCWFLHEHALDEKINEGDIDNDNSELENAEERLMTNQSVFQDVQENLDPPILKNSQT